MVIKFVIQAFFCFRTDVLSFFGSSFFDDDCCPPHLLVLIIEDGGFMQRVNKFFCHTLYQVLSLKRYLITFRIGEHYFQGPDFGSQINLFCRHVIITPFPVFLYPYTLIVPEWRYFQFACIDVRPCRVTLSCD